MEVLMLLEQDLLDPGIPVGVPMVILGGGVKSEDGSCPLDGWGEIPVGDPYWILDVPSEGAALASGLTPHRGFRAF